MSDEALSAMEDLRGFLYKEVYYNSKVHCEFDKARGLIERLWEHFMEDEERFYTRYRPSTEREAHLIDAVRDFVAGMTDAFAVTLHERIFVPRRWIIM